MEKKIVVVVNHICMYIKAIKYIYIYIEKKKITF